MADINISKLKLPNDNNTYHFKDTVSGYTNNTGTVTSVIAGTGLNGGTISTSGTISVKYGSSSGTACAGNDSRLSNARPSSDVVQTYSSTSTVPISGKGVAAALATLPSPMVFKGSLGTGGTITALPVNGTATVGDTYKVITAGTYASQAAKIGDMFICDSKTSSANTWIYIPSADEPSGTVTSIATGTGLTGGTITTSGTLSHADTSSQESVSNSGRTYIQSVTLDSMGHVTGLTSATETVTNTDTKVRQTLKSDDANRPLLMSYAGNTSTTSYVDNVSYRANAIYANASSGKIYATGFVGSIAEGTGLTSTQVTTALGYTPPTTDTNTTYTLSADTTNNKITLTPSSGSANSITVPYATTAGSAPASDVYTWAKASSKPSYTASEVGAAASSHTHGNIQNGGTLQTNDITIASGDKLVVTDSSNSAKVARTSVSFDGSTATKCLTQKGTWESFTNNAGTVTSVKVGTTSYSPSSGVVSLPAYPTTLPASDVYSWAKASTKPSYTASEVGALASTTKYAGSDSAGGAANTVKIKTPTFSTTGNAYSILLNNTSSDVSSSGRASIFGSGIWTTLGLGFPTAGSIKLFADNGGYNEIRPNSNLTSGDESIQYLPYMSGTLLNTQSPVAGSDSYGGPATAANKLINDVTVGTSYNPVYFYQGLPLACKYTFDSGNIASKGTAQVVGIQRGLIIISRGTAGAGVYFIDHWYGVATAVNNANFTVTCSNGTATLKNNHASLQATYFAIYYKQ